MRTRAQEHKIRFLSQSEDNDVSDLGGSLRALVLGPICWCPTLEHRIYKQENQGWRSYKSEDQSKESDKREKFDT